MTSRSKKEATPDAIKDRAGKPVRSATVPWVQYDDCVDLLYNLGPYSLIHCSSDLANTRVHMLLRAGAAIIKAIKDLGMSPELELTKADDAGVGKYERLSWQQGIHVELSCEAAWRHVNAHLNGVEQNPDPNGASHLAHALWNVLVALWTARHRKDLV